MCCSRRYRDLGPAAGLPPLAGTGWRGLAAIGWHRLGHIIDVDHECIACVEVGAPDSNPDPVHVLAGHFYVAFMARRGRAAIGWRGCFLTRLISGVPGIFFPCFICFMIPSWNAFAFCPTIFNTGVFLPRRLPF